MAIVPFNFGIEIMAAAGIAYIVKKASEKKKDDKILIRHFQKYVVPAAGDDIFHFSYNKKPPHLKY